MKAWLSGWLPLFLREDNEYDGSQLSRQPDYPHADGELHTQVRDTWDT